MIDQSQGRFWEPEHPIMHALAGLLDSPPVKRWAEALLGGKTALDGKTDCQGTWYKPGDYTLVHSHTVHLALGVRC